MRDEMGMRVKLNYRRYGSGPVLVILHGLYGSSDNWITIARKLEDHFTVLLPDLRNHGASPHLPSHTFEDMTADLVQFFSDTATEKAFIIGHSMGGKLAMRFAAENPQKTTRLMVVDIAPKNYLAGKPAFRHIRQHEMILELLQDADLNRYHTRKELDDFFASRIREGAVRHFLLKNIHRAETGKFEWKINAPVLHAAFSKIVSETGADWFNEFTPITGYPVTFVRGENSEYILDADWPEIKKIYPEAKLFGIENAGHWLHAEQPDAFVSLVFENDNPAYLPGIRSINL